MCPSSWKLYVDDFPFFSSSLACLEPELELFEVWEINVRFEERNAFEEPNDQHRRYYHYLQEPDAGINLHSFLQSVRRGK